MSDNRLDAFDTGFEHGKGINTNPVKEKLTPKIISKEIIENFDTLKLSWHGMTGIQFHIVTFLEQIREEIRKLEGDGYEGQRMIDVIEIEQVLNKYLNEK
jgi:hypothetical protein